MYMGTVCGGIGVGGGEVDGEIGRGGWWDRWRDTYMRVGDEIGGGKGGGGRGGWRDEW